MALDIYVNMRCPVQSTLASGEFYRNAKVHAMLEMIQSQRE